MPYEEFIDDGFEILLDRKTRFADRKGDFVEATGSEKRFAWYLQRCRASLAGVKARLGETENDDPEPNPPKGGKAATDAGSEGFSPPAEGPESSSRSTGASASVNPSLRSAPFRFAIAPLPLRSESARKNENGENSGGACGQNLSQSGESNPAVIAKLIGRFSRYSGGPRAMSAPDDPEERRRILREQAKHMSEGKDRDQVTIAPIIEPRAFTAKANLR